MAQSVPAGLHGGDTQGFFSKPGPLVELSLTLPIFLVYHLGVVFLRVRNGTDLVTGELLRIAEGSRWLYLAITSAIGLVFAGVFAWLGRGEAFQRSKFLQIAVEGAFYAFLMRLLGGYIVTRVFAAAGVPMEGQGPFVGVVMSLGAGFYEELTFRVLLFGMGAKAMVWAFAGEHVGLVQGGPPLSFRAGMMMIGWAVVSALFFSAIHYIGPLADPFALPSFSFRWVLGLSLTLIFVLRGFAAAVWTHALYDIGVLVL